MVAEFRADERTDEEFRQRVLERRERCGCGDSGHRNPESWCARCRACVDCCQCGEHFEPVRGTPRGTST